MWPQSHLMLYANVAQDGGYSKSREGTGFQVQLLEHMNTYLVVEFQLKDGR